MTTTPQQNLILLQLALEGPSTATGLKYNKDVKKHRDPLVQEGLVARNKKGRSIRFELTDRGWEYLDGLEKIHIAKSQAAAPLLEKFFSLTSRHLHKKSEPLAALMMPESAGLPQEPVTNEGSIPQAIRRAYRQAAAHDPGCEVRLKHLKAGLPGLDAETVNLCLMGMVMAGEAELRQFDDPFLLDEADYAAGINLGGTVRHMFRLVR